MNTENTLNSELKSLSKKTRQYRAGEGVPNKTVEDHRYIIDINPDGLGCVPYSDPDFEVAYEDALDQALSIMLKFSNTVFTDLPGNESRRPKNGLRKLEEWCYRNIKPAVAKKKKKKAKLKRGKSKAVSPSLNEKLFSDVEKKEPAQKFYDDIVWGDVKSPTKYDKFIVTGKIDDDKVEVYERTLIAKLAKASTYICLQARRWYEEEIVGDIAEWYKRWYQQPFRSRLDVIEDPCKDADYSLTYMNMTAFRDNLKDGYKEIRRVADQCDRERIDYRGDLPTAPIREFKAAAAKFHKVVNAICIKSNAEWKKLTKPASGSVSNNTEIKPETKAKIKPKAETWSQVSIVFLDDDTVRYKIANEPWKRANYVELGFNDKRKALPNKLWPMFREMAKNNSGGYFTVNTISNISVSSQRL